MKAFSFRRSFSYRGREFRGLSGFAGKPFHPPLTDVTIAAYIIAPVFNVLSFFAGPALGHELYRAAQFVFITGALTSVATTLTGFFDWRTTTKSTQIRRTINAHAWTMITMSVFVVVAIVLHLSNPNETNAPATTAIVSLVVAVLAILGGVIGGTIVFDYGFNVENSKDHPVYHASETDV